MKKILFTFLMFLSPVAFSATMNLSWDQNPPDNLVTHYLCEYSINGGAFQQCASNPVPPPASPSDRVLVSESITANSGDTVTGRAIACNSVGCSGPSSGVSGVVPASTVPPNPLGIIIELVADTP